MDSKTTAPLVGWLLGWSLLGCGNAHEGEPTGGRPPDPEPPGSLAPAIEPGRVLAQYAWEDQCPVPWLSAAPPERLLFGEVGRSARTRLYLTCNGDLEEERRFQSPGCTLAGSGLASVEGRFGGGMGLGPDSVLRLTVPDEAQSLGTWTLETWIRPERSAKGRLVEVPGILTLACDRRGRLRLEMPGATTDAGGKAGIVVEHPTLLEAGRWHHLGLVLDLADLMSVRIVVDETVRGSRLDPASVPGLFPGLVLGDAAGDGSGLPCTLDEVRFLSQNLSTSELMEHWALARRPVERLRLTYAPDGSPGDRSSEEELEFWREPRTQPVLASRAALATGELIHAFASPQGLTSTPEYWRALRSDERPIPRTTHAVADLGDRKVFVFGGETRDTHFGRGPNTDDTWVFDGAASTWTRVLSPLSPSRRCHTPAAFSPDHGLVLMLGGWWQGGWWTGATPEERYNDTWVFHVAEGRWEARSPQGPDAIHDNGLVYLPQERRFLLLKTRSVSLYDPATDRWEDRPPFQELTEDDRPVLDRSPYSCTTVLEPGTGRVYLFGGVRGEDHYLDRTAYYDLEANRVTVLNPRVRPAARVRAAVAYDPLRKRFVLFGGVRDQRSRRFDDLWTFDPLTRTWSEVPPGADRPIARGGYFGMTYDGVADHFVLTSGRHAHERWLDETLALELDERREGTARYVFDRAAFPDDLSWYADGETPGTSTLRFRFRTSDDGLRFGPWIETCPVAGRFAQVEVVLRPGEAGERPLLRSMGFRAPN